MTDDEPKLTFHAVHPGIDGDKCVCGVRISQAPHRRKADLPADLTCVRCFLRCLRSWQKIDPDVEVLASGWRCWPWEDDRFTYGPMNMDGEEG